jgi:hypothetical protein
VEGRAGPMFVGYESCLYVNTHRVSSSKWGGGVGQQQQGGARAAVQAHTAYAGLRHKVGVR